jgi:hypothetical protein
VSGDEVEPPAKRFKGMRCVCVYPGCGASLDRADAERVPSCEDGAANRYKTTEGVKVPNEDVEAWRTSWLVELKMQALEVQGRMFVCRSHVRARFLKKNSPLAQAENGKTPVMGQRTNSMLYDVNNLPIPRHSVMHLDADNQHLFDPSSPVMARREQRLATKVSADAARIANTGAIRKAFASARTAVMDGEESGTYGQSLSACVQTSWVCIDSSTAVVASQKEGFAFGVPVHPKVLYSRLRLEYSCEKLYRRRYY